MAGELGSRLLRAGVVTGRQLADARRGDVPSSGRLVAALCEAGVWDRAIAGYLVAHGFGPVVHPAPVVGGDSPLSEEEARAIHALPLSRRGSAWVVAMADPSDGASVERLRRALGADVTPALAPSGDLDRAIRAAYPSPGTVSAASSTVQSEVPPGASPPPAMGPHAPMEPAPASLHDETAEEEAPVELVRKRPSAAPTEAQAMGPDAPSESGPVATPSEAVASKPVSRSEDLPAPASEETTEEEAEALPLVRPKPAAPAPTEESPEPTPPSPTEAGTGLVEPASPEPAAPAPTGAGPVPAEQDRWSAPPSDRPPPLEPTPESIAEAPDRDSIVLRACEALCTVARQGVFLAVRKNMLRGFAGSGEGIHGEALGNLWIPIDEESHIGRVARTGEPYDGVSGTRAADAVFKAATGARGHRMVIEPVRVQERTVGVVVADEVRYGEEGARRVAQVAQAVGEGFRRLLLQAKRGSGVNRP